MLDEEIKEENNINNDLIKALNDHIGKEEYMSRLYLSFSLWLRHNGWEGLSRYWEKMKNEKEENAKILYDYFEAIDVLPEVNTIEKIEKKINSINDIVTMSEEEEEEMTEEYYNIIKLSRESNDVMTESLFLKYSKEHIQDILKLNTIKKAIENANNDNASLLIISERYGR